MISMDRITICVPCLVLLLVACLLIAGCQSSDSVNQTAQSGITAITTNGGAQYTAGDIVRNPKSTATTAWLVIGYNPTSDTYERALIYPKTDGSWGYRTDSRTENADRTVMEKVYTEVLDNIPPSSVPLVTPTTIATEAPTPAPVAVTAVTTAVSTAPKITKIIPDTGYAGTSVAISDLVGENFVTGIIVTLSHSGSSTVTATNVRVISNKSLICTFAIPSEATAGSWDVGVTNPDGQSDRYTNIFTVHRDASAVTTTTATSAGTVPITYIDPSIGHTGYSGYTITGSKFQSGATVKLQRSGYTDIEGTTVIVDSDTQLHCFFTIPTGDFGTWDIKVTNPDSTYGITYNAFTIN
jgi:hypothetical protein